MNTPKVSVIIPAYNAEAFLPKCLDSVVDQTIDSYEVIVINDGSTDGTQTIIDSYQQKYPAIIRSFITENSGVASTRNFGVTQSRGEYLSFVDCDDYVDFDFLERMYNRAVEEDADVVCSPVTYVRRDLIEKRYYSRSKFGKPAIEEPYILKKGNAYCPNKIYRRSFWLDNGFEFDNQWYEDSKLIYIVLLKANKVSCVNIPFYHYVTFREGTAVGKTGERVFDVFKSTDAIINCFKEMGEFENSRDTVEYLCLRHLFARIEALHNSRRRILAWRYVRRMLSYLNSNFPQWRLNKYFDSGEIDPHLKDLRSEVRKDDLSLKLYACGLSYGYTKAEQEAREKDLELLEQRAKGELRKGADSTGNKYCEYTIRDVGLILSRIGIESAAIEAKKISICVQALPSQRGKVTAALERAGYMLTDRYLSDGETVLEAYDYYTRVRFYLVYCDPDDDPSQITAPSEKDASLRHYMVSYSEIKRRTRETPEPILVDPEGYDDSVWEKACQVADMGYDPVVFIPSKEQKKNNRHPRVRSYVGDPQDPEFTDRISRRVASRRGLRDYDQIK